jgi:hypothetical protein
MSIRESLRECSPSEDQPLANKSSPITLAWALVEKPIFFSDRVRESLDREQQRDESQRQQMVNRRRDNEEGPFDARPGSPPTPDDASERLSVTSGSAKVDGDAPGRKSPIPSCFGADAGVSDGSADLAWNAIDIDGSCYDQQQTAGDKLIQHRDETGVQYDPEGNLPSPTGFT